MKHYLLILSFGLILKGKAQVIYNAYAKVTSITNNTLLAVNNVNQVNHSFVVNDLIVVMQMQDDVIGANTANNASFGNLSAIKNAGRFEVAKVTAVNLSAGTPTSIAVATALSNTFNLGANSSVQIISYRKLSAAAFTSTNNITGLAWNGNIGGVIAIEVGTVFTLGHSITADGLGFRGGAKNTPNFASTSCDPTYATAIGNKWAGKGEGIYKSTNASYTGARGKILNGGGGGNDENSGGGGGGNYTAGGVGGPGYTGGATGCSPSVGGLGGIALSGVIGTNRIFMGGGGGAGHENNSVGTAGGAGGGIILLKTGTLVTTGACGGLNITANGITPPDAGNDGSGGGGAAGTIVLQVNTFSVVNTCSLNILSNGGSGGNAVVGVTHSGGGGGAQGVIMFSYAQPTANVNASTASGTGGLSCSGCASSVNATSGGGPNNSGVFTNLITVLPISLLNFDAKQINKSVVLDWATTQEKNMNYFIVEKSKDGIAWQNVERVKAAINSYAKINYESIDESPFRGISYYRLKLVDADASVFYSSISVVEFLQEESFEIFPNPSSGNFNLKIKSVSGSEPLKINVFDSYGRKVFEETIQIEQNRFDYSFSTLLGQGLYTITIDNNSETLKSKIVICN